MVLKIIYSNTTGGKSGHTVIDGQNNTRCQNHLVCFDRTVNCKFHDALLVRNNHFDACAVAACVRVPVNFTKGGLVGILAVSNR